MLPTRRISWSKSVVIPAIAVLVLAVSGHAATTPAAKKATASTSGPSRQYTIEQFLATTTLTGASFSADEKKILYSSNETGIYNVYSMPVSGGASTAMTTSTTDNNFAVSYFPNDDRILYRRDQGGNENDHLYVRGLDGKETDLTPGDKLKAIFGGWTHEGDAFYLLTNERDPRFFDVVRVEAKSYERTPVYRDSVGYEFGGVSNDRKWIAFTKVNTTSDSDIYVWSVDSGQMKLISQHAGEEILFQPADFDPDSKWLYYLTNEKSEFTHVKRYSLASGQSEDVEKADWDVDFTGFSHNGRYRVTRVNADATTEVRLWDVQTGKQVPLPKLPGGEITSIVIPKSETRMAFYVNGDRSPNNLYVFTFGSKEPVRLTQTLSKDIDPKDLVEASVIRFRSFDGMEIPCILFKPLGASPSNKAPAIVWVHGGPGGQTRKGYSAAIQYLVNHGYAVLGINNRGSSGYGKTFYTADDGKHGREPLWDCTEAKKYLAKQPYIDGDRVAILGGSYGGYMTLAALAYQPEVFRAGVDLFGVANWIRTLESIPSYWESQRKALYKEIGDPTTERDKLHDISPLFAADKIKRPLLVLQGANDPRVIKPESDDIVAAVKKNNVPVEYIVFPDEGHGFAKKKNQAEGYTAILKFLDTYVKGEGGPTSSAGAPATQSANSSN